MGDAQIRLRPVVPGDCERFWLWRNEAATRLASFDTAEIPYETHEKWFCQKILDPEFRCFVGVDPEGLDVGYVRFDLEGESARISVGVAADRRNQGYGRLLIEEASRRLLGDESVGRVMALIREDNPVSLRAFERAGFVRCGEKVHKGIPAFELYFPPDEGQVPSGP